MYTKNTKVNPEQNKISKDLTWVERENRLVFIYFSLCCIFFSVIFIFEIAV
jgi:hypothetical protein